MKNQIPKQNTFKAIHYFNFKMLIIVSLLITIPNITVWGQVHAPNGTVIPTTNPTSNNLGINESTPNANIEIYHPVPPLGLSIPALKIRSNNYYLPPGEGIPTDPCPPQSNIIEIDEEFGTPGCVNPTPIIPAIVPSKRLLTLTQNGNLGLNIENPRTILHLHNPDPYNDIISLSYSDRGEDWNYLNLGTNYLAFNAKLENSLWRVDRGSYKANSFRLIYAWGGFDFDVYSHPAGSQGATSQAWTPFTEAWKTAMRIHWNGNIKMGTKSVLTGPHNNYKLSVDGKIVAKEVVITNGPEWGDYVFNDDYYLPPLSEVEKYIVSNNHLSNIPSAQEIAENGIDVSDLMNRQMVKIEELTLYVIEQQKEIDRLKQLVNQILEKQ